MITNGYMKMSKKGNKSSQPKVETNEDKELKTVEGQEQGSETVVEGSEQTGGTPAQGTESSPEGSTEGEGDNTSPAGIQEQITDPVETTVVSVEEVETEVAAELNLNCQTILDYAISMAPNKPNDKLTILRNQMKLYQAITAIMNNLEGVAFTEAFGSALEIMAEHKGTFADNMLFRGFNEMRVPPASRARFENILVLMSSTADKEGRGAALKAISFDTLLGEYPAEVGQKIRGFYSSK